MTAALVLGLAALVGRADAAPPRAAPGPVDSVAVSATLSAERVRPGDHIILQILVETDGVAPQRVETPALPAGLDVVRTQDFSELQFSYPGGRQRRFRREIVIVGHVPGPYTIPPARIEVAGRSYATQPLSLVIEPPGASPDGGALAPGESRLRVWFEPDTVFVGQQLLLRMEALIPDGVRPRRSRAPTFEAPAPPGFWVQELPQSRHSSLRLIGSGVFEAHTFSRAYFPITAGSTVVTPAAVVFDAGTGLFGGVQARRITSDSLRVEILPIPTTGRPAGFRGAVGKYTMSASLEPADVRVGDAALLTVVIRGEGNVKGLPAPELNAIPAVELMAAPEESETWASDGLLHGLRRFRWHVVPERAGLIEIGTIEYVFFDPFARGFEVLESEPLRLRATAGTIAGTTTGSADAPTLRRAPEPQRLGWTRHPAFAALHIVPVIALLGVMLLRRHRRVRHERAARAGSAPDWRSRLLAPEITPAAVRDIIAAVLAARFGGRPGDYADSAAALSALVARGAAPGIRTETVAILRAIEAYRFGGASWSEPARAKLLARCRLLLEQLEAGGKGTRVAALAVGIFMAATLAAAPLHALATAAEPTATFQAGVTAFDAGDFHVAARRFDDYVDAEPGDAAGWYNLGAAWYAAGERGLAGAAWLRAATLRPRADDTRAQLELVGAGAVWQLWRPPLGLAAEEAILAASALFWLLCGSVVLLLARRRRPAFTLGGVTLVMLLAGALAWSSHERTARMTAAPLDEPAHIRAAPALHADAVATVGMFTPLRIVERRDGWIRVRTPAAAEGWLESARAATR